MLRAPPLALLFLLLLLVSACGGTSRQVAKPPPRAVAVDNQIIGTRVAGTPKELRERGERALLAQSWQEAVDAFEALLAGDPASADDPQLLYDLALAYEGVGAREKARVRYREVVRRFPEHATARNAIVREVSLDAYLEDWEALGEVGAAILERAELDPAERMLGLGARGLARVQAGDETGASRDIQEGLDLVDEHRYGATGQLPVAAAMLKFAHGELRKLRSEKISLNPPGDDFVLRLELRCAHLLDAQSAYADAIRSVDPHWAAMSGYRVGEMYRRLHQDLMRIPPTAKAKTEKDRDLFYGIMRVRYRVLLEKGIAMMERTLALGERTGVASAWMQRAEQARLEMEQVLVEEKAKIEASPYTEAELEAALEVMKKNLAKREAAKGR
jgi:tetratricopeptide (TPR) repeat protein